MHALNVIKRREVSRKKGLTSDQAIEYSGPQIRKKYEIALHRIGYRDPETGRDYVFITNHSSGISADNSDRHPRSIFFFLL